MCGIIGYFGPKATKDVLIEGLKKMEYRGYDSAGVAILDSGHFKRHRALGKIKNLETVLENSEFNGKIGIAHTRWATHGVPSERNAHPHLSNDISIVHNGIIENFKELRKDLESCGVRLESDTDTEVIAHLIYRDVEKSKDLLTAVYNVLPRLKGAFSVVVVWDGQPDEMVAFKNGPPLVFGKTKEEVLIASDIQAIIEHTSEVCYIKDGDVLKTKGTSFQLFDSCGTQKKINFVNVQWNQVKAEKQGHKHFMAKEIYEQPRSLAASIQPHIDLETLTANFDSLIFNGMKSQDFFKELKKLVIVACGTSFYTALEAKYIIEKLSGIPVEVDIGSEFRYRNPVLEPDSLVLFISQSGETADTIACLNNVKKQNLPTMSLINVPHSTLDREVDARLFMNSGVEVSVCSTKSFICSVAILNLFGIFIGRLKNHLTDNEEKMYINELLALPSKVERVLAYDKYFEKASNNLKNYKTFLYLGRGVNYPIALEGALKLKELAYLHAEGYAAGEMKHGPIALVDNKMVTVVICPKDELYDKTYSNLQEIKARDGDIISIGTERDSSLEESSNVYLGLPEATWNLYPILAVIPLQLMAYHLADAMGKDVDQPRNLAKSVTVE